MTTQLEIRTPRGGRHTVTLEGEHVEVGRSPQCAVRLPYATLSGRHLRFDQRDGSWEVTDLRSRNGTRLDGLPLVPGEPMRVADGARIEAGGITFEVIVVAETGSGFSLSESGTMLRRLVAESLRTEGSAFLRSRDGRVVDVPDFAAQLAVDEFQIDRRGHGFWLTPVGVVRVAQAEVPPEGLALRDGLELVGARTWTFHDPLEAAIARVDEPEEPAVGGSSARGRTEQALVWVGGAAALLSAAALLVLFEIF